MKAKSEDFFLTHHAPPGAWASLTFGVPGLGASISHETNEFEADADLLVALSRGPGKVTALPFVSGASALDPETVQREAAAGKLDGLPNSPKARWSFVREEDLERNLGVCVDSFRHGDFSFRVIHRPPVFSDYERPAGRKKLASELAPAILLEVEVDNTASKEAAFAFLGVAIFRERLRTLDLEAKSPLCGVGRSNRWVLGALPVKGKVYTVRDGAIAKHVERGASVKLHKGREGGVMMRVEPGRKGVLCAALAFHRFGPATQNPESSYAYASKFRDAEASCLFALKNAAAIRKEASAYDAGLESRFPDPIRRGLAAQAIRSYAANTQMTLRGAQPFFNVPEGQYYWRNTMDLCADHLPFEMDHSPWVVRHLMDRFLSTYSFRDRLRFPGEKKLHPGGLSFTHDMGSFATWAPKGESLYEQAELTGCYSHMTQEELLNGVFLLGAIALRGGEDAWVRRNRKAFEAVLESMERRDHFDAARRDGILKGESDRVGVSGSEITSYDALDHSLMAARGNGYIALKTFAAALILEATFRRAKDAKAAERAKSFASRTAATLEASFDSSKGLFPANLYASGESAVSAMVEPLSVPSFLGLDRELRGHAGLMAKLKTHVATCLKPGVCLDGATGGLRLSSTSNNTWPSKAALVIDVAERIFGIELPASVMREYAVWCRVAARETTISDQIESDLRRVKGASWYPRIVSTWVWAKRKLPA